MFDHSAAFGTLLVSMSSVPTGGASGSSDVGAMLIFYGGLFAIFYFLLIRPQSKRNKEVRTIQETLKKGDRVITNGGLLGSVHKVDDDYVTLEIAEGVRVKAQRGAIFSRIEAKPDAAAK